MAGQEAEIGALGIIILAGVVGRLFLKKTGFSDVFLLLLFGAAAGALLPQGSAERLGGLLLPLGAVALLMIILEEGLRLSVGSLRGFGHKALLFGLASFSLSFAASFAVSYFGLGMQVAHSLVVAAIFASVAPELLSGFLIALGASEGAKAIGEIEATFSDALSVMLALLLASLASEGALAGGFAPDSLPLEIGFVLALSCAAGAVAAALWKGFVSKIAEENEHLVAIGFAAALYALSGNLGGNGVVAVFVFSFFLGNTSHRATDELRRFHSEITFFLRTFFFIYLGVLLFQSEKPAAIALAAGALALLLAFARAAAGRLAGALDSSARRGRLLETVSARGLTAAVLAVVVSGELSAAGAPFPVDLPLFALFVIFFSNLISALLVLRKRKLA